MGEVAAAGGISLCRNGQVGVEVKGGAEASGRHVVTRTTEIFEHLFVTRVNI